MDDLSAFGRVAQVANLRDYFRTSIDDVVEKQGVDLDPHVAHYVVNLLTLYSRSEELYEDDGDSYGIKPLALMLADATSARSTAERNQHLQRIGDVSLFISGFFIDSLSSKAVDVDYYIQMGGSAYGSLSEEVRGTFRGRAFSGTYRQLSEKFPLLIDILNEISDGSREDSDANLLRTYEIWRKTGSRRCENFLRKQGVVPFTGTRQRRH